MLARYPIGYSPQARTGVLLVNLGTPDAPTPRAVRRYLREFLSDPRVVELPRMLWLPILYGLILPLRSRRAAAAYRSIWNADGSPLLAHTRALARALDANLGSANVQVITAMRYGQPSIAHALATLRAAQVERIVIAPLYPQYAAATTASIYDAVMAELAAWRYIPALTWLGDYHDHPVYLDAVAARIRQQWQQHGQSDCLLLSFHGLPERSRQLGDPYAEQCQRSAQGIAERLNLAPERWRLVYQSRFGRAEWLKPYCVDTLKALPAEGVCSVDVACPGFAVDCLETLEEIAEQNRQIFIQSGGQQYHYIPALNATAEHVELWRQLILPALTPYRHDQPTPLA